MKFLDLFSGIGGFRHGLERAGHTCVGHAEIDKFANQSYMAMYELEYCKFGKKETINTCMMCQREVNKNCDGQNCKGEYYGKDIKCITAGEIPQAEIWTFGFPCTDISLSGQRAGLYGSKSGLFFEVTRLLQGQSHENKPRWFIVENVKHLLSIESGGLLPPFSVNFPKLGMTVSGKCKIPKTTEYPKIENECTLWDILEVKVPEKYFLSPEQTRRLLSKS